MNEPFVSLAASLHAAAAPDRGARAALTPPPEARAEAVTTRELTEPAAAPAHGSPVEALTSDLTMVRLAASEAFERRARRLVATLARDVLARELALAPADIEALVGSALAAFAEHDPIAISVAAADADRVRADLPFRIDPQLHPGDLIVHVADGSFESPLAFRLAEAVDGRAL